MHQPDRNALKMLQFEGYTLDIVRNALRAADREIALRPKSFELLRYLVENPDRLVTKEELLKAVWPNVAVADEALTHCVSEVRQAIGDGNQTIIKTIPRRGYRFAAPVLRVAAGAAPAAPSPLVGEGRGGGSGAFGTDVPDGSTPTPDPSPQGGGDGPRGRLGDRPAVAVLPFANLSGDPQQEYFSDGITEDIITELSRFSELLVIARHSSFQYKGKAVDIRQVGRELGASYVLEGSVRRSGDRIRITAQLIDAVTGAHRWGERYNRELHDVFAVQDEVARTIVTTLSVHVERAEIERARLKPPAAWDAYEYYLRGAETSFLLLSRGAEALLYEARRLLEQCLAIDPDYARAAAMLANTHLFAYLEPLDGDYLRPAALDRAVELAQRAVHLDPRLPEARAQLGQVLLCKGRHDDALAEFERAFALNPNFIDHRYALALILAGEPARAIEVLELNMRLDPFRTGPFQFMGVAHYMLKRYGEAVRWLRESASRRPNMQASHAMLAAAYAQSGQLEEARYEAAEVLRINPGFTIESWKPLRHAHKYAKDLEHRIDGLRKAGLPES
ncbi:MAG TPA: tetratricopeptide repeat protein [Xanthobacteraceae bacterium]|nr:tetratricopeptide repeat protein [Xanthobacteraceae bacterium]